MRTEAVAVRKLFVPEMDTPLVTSVAARDIDACVLMREFSEVIIVFE